MIKESKNELNLRLREGRMHVSIRRVVPRLLRGWRDHPDRLCKEDLLSATLSSRKVFMIANAAEDRS